MSLSSTENLATWQRQEPQGEETQTPLYQHLDDGSYSILARLGMPQGAIEQKGGSEQVSSSPSSSSPFYSSGSNFQSYYSHPSHSQSVYATTSSVSGRDNAAYVVGGSGSQQNLTVPHSWQVHGLPPPQSGQYSRSHTPTYHHPHPYVNTWTNVEGVGGGYTGQTSQFLSHPPHLPPPPQYPGHRNIDIEKKDLRRSYETIAGKTELRHSHPDLSTESPLSHSQTKGDGLPTHLGAHAGSEPIFSITGSSPVGSHEEVDQTALIEMLREDNRRLRDELSSCHKKVSKLQKFELEIQKVHEAYESLVKSSQKRERLEAALKTKLEEEVKKLRLQNDELRVQVEQSSDADQARSSRQDSLDSNKSQREILDAKLAATQNSLSRLEEEVRKKDAQAGRVEQLQKAFTSLQTTSERREEKEKQLRSRLERELETYKSQEKGVTSGSSTPKEEPRSMAALKQVLSERETKILQLETEIIRWEQRYVEMQAVQQMEETAGPQEVHLAVLEKSSAETEKLIDEAKTEKLRHMEELYQSNRRVAELEAKVKWLQTQLSEKEAMVKVYQRAPPTLPRSSSVHAICCSPLHSPRPSLIATTAYTRSSGGAASSAGTGSYCDFVTIKHVKTGSTSAIETGRKMSLDDSLCERRQAHCSTSDTEDETKLWQV